MTVEQLAPFSQGEQPRRLSSEFARYLAKYHLVNQDYLRPDFPRYRRSEHSVNIERFTTNMLAETGLFTGVYPAHAKIDVEDGIDVFLELPSGRVIAVDVTFTGDSERQFEKMQRFRDFFDQHIFNVRKPLLALQILGGLN